ncbi:hypothetical protein BJ165DRAFT_1599182 [Panaeolus papilionaceus]|nr:hypothetical protein BJ165DRAFT_1599182 [Panaeolus papilionaceus]
MKGLNPGVAPLYPRAIVIALGSHQAHNSAGSPILFRVVHKENLLQISLLYGSHFGATFTASRPNFIKTNKADSIALSTLVFSMDFADSLLVFPPPPYNVARHHALKRNSDDGSHPAVATTTYHEQGIVPRRPIFVSQVCGGHEEEDYREECFARAIEERLALKPKHGIYPLSTTVSSRSPTRDLFSLVLQHFTTTKAGISGTNVDGRLNQAQALTSSIAMSSVHSRHSVLIIWQMLMALITANDSPVSNFFACTRIHNISRMKKSCRNKLVSAMTDRGADSQIWASCQRECEWMILVDSNGSG